MFAGATRIQPQDPLVQRVQAAIHEYKQGTEAVPERQVERALKHLRDTLFVKHFPRSAVRKVFRGSFYGRWGLECGSGRVMVELLPTGELKAMYRGDSLVISPKIGSEFEKLVEFINRYA